MQIRATKVFAKELSKRLKGNYCIESVELVKIPRDRAYLAVGGGYSDVDIDWNDNTVKVLKVNYNWCIDYDVYKPNGNPNYLDGGKVCDVSKMPLTDKGFWMLIRKKFKEHIK